MVVAAKVVMLAALAVIVPVGMTPVRVVVRRPQPVVLPSSKEPLPLTPFVVPR